MSSTESTTLMLSKAGNLIIVLKIPNYILIELTFLSKLITVVAQIKRVPPFFLNPIVVGLIFYSDKLSDSNIERINIINISRVLQLLLTAPTRIDFSRP